MKATTAILLTTICMVVFYIFLHFNPDSPMAVALYFAIPIIMVAMVFVVLLDDSRECPQLGNNEWGYLDKNKEDLGMF